VLPAIFAIGINHDSASLEVREQVAFAPEKIPQALSEAMAQAPVEELVILSTCNRTELYGVLKSDADAIRGAESLMAWLSVYHGVSLSEISQFAYQNHGRAALTHLVRVAAGLNSMVLGEPQIFGQLKSAYAVAQEAGAVGDGLGRLFPEAFRVAKRVRTDTAIGENPVSVAYAAVDLAGHIFSDLSAHTALLLGAGETVELVARHLREAKLGRLIIANRTLARAEALAEQLDAEAVLLADVTERLAEADIVVSSTASQLPILGKGAVEAAAKQRRWRPMLMIDLAVPRDIEPQVAELPDVYLYTVDDLREVIEENLKLRASEASKADEIVQQGVVDIETSLVARQSVDVVRSYRQSALTIQEAELERALRAIERGENPDAVLRRLARDLTNKLIHAPTTGLRRAAEEGDLTQVSRIAELLGVAQRDEGTTLQ
jgi:glutamyl-tRNA reductase